MKATVVEPYERPYENPIVVVAGEQISPDFDRKTDIEGWVWCTANDGRSGWTPIEWLMKSRDVWNIDRDFNAIELTIVPGEKLEIELEQSGFFLARNQNGDVGWIPCGSVSVDRETAAVRGTGP